MRAIELAFDLRTGVRAGGFERVCEGPAAGRVGGVGVGVGV